MPRNRITSGICPGCNKLKGVNRAGRMRSHDNESLDPEIKCSGVGYPPLKDSADFVRPRQVSLNVITRQDVQQALRLLPDNEQLLETLRAMQTIENHYNQFSDRRLMCALVPKELNPTHGCC